MLLLLLRVCVIGFLPFIDFSVAFNWAAANCRVFIALRGERTKGIAVCSHDAGAGREQRERERGMCVRGALRPT